jgi:hypothetical protein
MGRIAEAVAQRQVGQIAVRPQVPHQQLAAAAAGL